MLTIDKVKMDRDEFEKTTGRSIEKEEQELQESGWTREEIEEIARFISSNQS